MGVPVWVGVTALDANGHRVLNYGGTVTLTSTDPSVNVVVPGTAFEFGQAWVQVTFGAANPAATLTATDNSSPPLVATLAPIDVAVAGPSAYSALGAIAGRAGDDALGPGVRQGRESLRPVRMNSDSRR